MGSRGALVRLAARSDAASLARVRASIDPEDHTSASASFERLLAENNGLVYVADSEDVVIGYMALQQITHSAVQARSPLQLWQLYVIPAFQGSGVAAQLIDAALAHARGRKHDVIWLGVSEHNDRAIAFYRKHGFESLGIHLVGTADHAHQDLLMSRSVV